MNNKDIAVDGDVGQFVAGNVIREAPRAEGHFSNVINMGTSALEPRTITWQQDKAIKSRVDELMPILRKDRLEIYEEIFNEYSVSRRSEIPSDKYKSVMEMLDRLEAVASGAPESRSSATMLGPAACDGCSGLQRRLTRAKASVALASFVALGLAGTATYQFQSNARDRVALEASVSGQCQFEGKPYSPGSLAKMANSQTRECLDAGGSKGMQWATPSQQVWKRPR